MGIVVSPCLSAFILVTNTSPNATCLTPTPQQARAPPREQRMSTGGGGVRHRHRKGRGYKFLLMHVCARDKGCAQVA